VAVRRLAIVLVPALAGPLIGLAPQSDRQLTAPGYGVVEELRLDAAKEDFSRIRFLYVSPRREIIIPLIQDLVIRRYDSTGKRLPSLGRRGSGPGEFGMIAPIGWKADTMWAGDEIQRRTSYFRPDGELIRTEVNVKYRPPTDAQRAADEAAGRREGIRLVNPMGILSDGSVVTYQRTDALRNRNLRSTDQATMALFLIAPNGRERTIAVLPQTWEEKWTMKYGNLYRTVPFGPSSRWAVSTNGDRAVSVTTRLTGSRNGTITVNAFETTGRKLFSRNFPFDGTPIPTRLRDSAIAALQPRIAGLDDGGAGGVVQAWQKMARERMPKVFPGIESLVLGLDDTIWLGLSPTAAGNPYVALSNAGEPVAAVVLPDRTRLMQATRSQIWAVSLDDDGLASVVRYRLTRTP
jgi:hypothetical protein